MISSFHFSSLPRIIFGPGRRAELPAQVARYGDTVLLVTGTTSIHFSGHGDEIISSLREKGNTLYQESIGSEPSPQMVDDIAGKYRGSGIKVVVAVGGGSVMDAGKAISAILLVDDSVKNYLEGVGVKEHPGKKIPFIAMPTTSGTGSEMTKNAVLSEIGEQGFKKSLRHDHFIPDAAIIDPEMMLTCPPGLTATSGMDAFTQLLESYLSKQSNPMTDALALHGLKLIKRNLLRAFLEGENNLEARSGMAIAAMFSGITLAHAGLGLVHGFASPFGAHCNIPHGSVCGTLMSTVNSMTIDKIIDNKKNSAYNKYLIVSKIFSDFKYKEDKEYLLAFKDKLEHISNVLEIPPLDPDIVNTGVIRKIVDETSHKHHPVTFSDEELELIIRKRLARTA
ncbi:MAG: iron-containing alcohol dehydrogenase [Bacteroidales bacterium]|nr:iron-containing alcohol dehydrogenase [Bacteroidales bacterium]MDT8430577.1 iron-containing alcohol dehydrogenase [Bacteroidales bacterium]